MPVISWAAAVVIGQQTTPTDNKKLILGVMDTFMKCIKVKDEEKFNSLFVDSPVAWIGVYKDAT